MSGHSDIQNSDLKSLLNQHKNPDELYSAIDQLITRNKEKIDYLTQEADRLSVIIDLIPNTISWVNRDMTYFGVNRALADTCHLSPEQFMGKPIGFHTNERFFQDFVTELFASKNNTIYHELEVNIGGVPHSYLVSGTKLKDKDKAVVIGVDITELIKLKGHVSFTEKLATLGEMFAGIIHDINNPLMSIEGNVRRIKKMVTDPLAHEYLDKIDMSSKKISKIVHGIKIFVRQDQAQPFQMEQLKAIIDDAIVICEHKLKENQVELRVDPKLSTIRLNCHFTQIFQVFVNLLSNAVDAIKPIEKKWIEMQLLENSDQMIKIQFSDCGPGIPKEIQEKIFNAFFTTKGRGVGSGLGLSLCSRILEAHNGKISIDNTNPNTTFIIEFKK